MADDRITIELTPQVPTEERRLSWYPCGARLKLEEKDGRLHGEFQIGEFPVVHVRLEKIADSDEGILELDVSGTGTFEPCERLTTTAEDWRGKKGYSFKYTVQLVQADGQSRPYPISLWHVEDPQDDEELTRMRWSRHGWHQGESVLCDGETCTKVLVLIADDDRDGVFDGEQTVWKLNTTETELHSPMGMRPLDDFTWLNGTAYRICEVDRDGWSITIEPFTPDVTEEEDKRNRDPYADDREAPKAKEPLTFETDLKGALAQAKSDGKRVFADFTATWCGPCSTMERLVFPAQAVVDAGKDIIFVKIDEKEQKDLVKEYEVEAYPTLILLDHEGKIIRRETGYQSVARTVEFLS